MDRNSLAGILVLFLCSYLLEQGVQLRTKLMRKSSNLCWIYVTGLLMGLVITIAYKGIVTSDLVKPPPLLKLETMAQVVKDN